MPESFAGGGPGRRADGLNCDVRRQEWASAVDAVAEAAVAAAVVAEAVEAVAVDAVAEAEEAIAAAAVPTGAVVAASNRAGTFRVPA